MCVCGQEPGAALDRPLPESLLGLQSAQWHRQTSSLLLVKALLISGLRAAACPGLGGGGGGSSRDLLPADADAPKSQKTAADAKLGSRKGRARAAGVQSGAESQKARVGVAGRSHSAAALAVGGGADSLRHLCANGHLRLLCWALLHSREEIRFLAAEVCCFVLSRGTFALLVDS